MFWKLVGILVRLIYFKRFRQADRLGAAARLITEGRAEDSLRLIDGERDSLHTDLRALFHGLRGRALEALERPGEAHAEYVAAATADPRSHRAQLDLALSEAAQGQGERALARLRHIADDADADRDLRDVAIAAMTRIEAVQGDEGDPQYQ